MPESRPTTPTAARRRAPPRIVHSFTTLEALAARSRAPSSGVDWQVHIGDGGDDGGGGGGGRRWRS